MKKFEKLSETERMNYIREHFDSAIELGWIRPEISPAAESEDPGYASAQIVAVWENPKYGRIGTEDLIPILKQAGLDARLHSYIIRKVRDSFEPELDHDRMRDPLTHAFSRTSAEKFLNDAFHRFLMIGENYAIMLVDIDDFSEINEKYGHDNGDRVLQNVAASMEKIIREQDRLIRWGNDEFLVVFANFKLKHDIVIKRKLTEMVSKVKVQTDKGSSPVRISAGITDFRKTDQTYTDAILRVESALLKAKKAGGARMIISGNTAMQ